MGRLAPDLMGRAFDTTGSYERVLIQFAVVTAGVAALMLVLPRYTLSQRGLPAERTV
jgi:hypothetical protein